MPLDNRSVNKLIELIAGKGEFGQTANSIACIRVRADDHREAYQIRSVEFKRFLSAEHYSAFQSSAPASLIDEAVATLEARALCEGKRVELFLRRASFGGKYYFDMCDKKWRAIEVDAGGWSIIQEAPVWFVRTTAMAELPVPRKGGRFLDLFDVINVPKRYRIILLTWLIECLRADTVDVGLMLFGVQGSAKTSAQDCLKELVDPMGSNVRAKPKGREDFFVAARNGMLLSYENLSDLSDAMQDALCTVLTGGEFTTRRFHTNGDEFAIRTQNPVVLNGINNVVTRPDLLDRFICIELPNISDENRRAATEVAREFKEMKGAVLGAVLTRFVQALRFLPLIIKEDINLPRMADFALLGEAVARAHKKPPGWFLESYAALRRTGVEQSLDGDAVGAAIRSYFALHDEPLEGTVGRVGDKLKEHWEHMPGMAAKSSDWPATEKAIGNALRRLEPALKHVRISVEWLPRHAHGNRVRIRRGRTMDAAA